MNSKARSLQILNPSVDIAQLAHYPALIREFYSLPIPKFSSLNFSSTFRLALKEIILFASKTQARWLTVPNAVLRQNGMITTNDRR